jgi:O-succinylbenzoate synthase
MDSNQQPTQLTRAWATVGRQGAVVLEAVELWLVELPFFHPVFTSKGAHRRRPLVLVQLIGTIDGRMVEGWGECAALADVTYDAEDVSRSFSALEHELIPALVEQVSGDDGVLPGPADLEMAGALARRTPLAFAALEMAVADVHLRAVGRSLADVLGVEGRTVALGAVVGTHSTSRSLVDEVSRLVADGFTRVKLKIGPGWDVDPVAAVTDHVPDLRLQVDANGSYGEADLDHLCELDRFGLLCLEQPFDRSDLDLHRRLAERIKTPVCLDESLDSPGTTASAIAMGACSVVCIKPSRLGGLGAALAVVEACTAKGVPLWMGGMYESGFARGVNTTLAALDGFAWPGDLSPSGTYLADDLVPGPDLTRSGANRSLSSALPRGPGMGPAPQSEVLERRKVRHRRIEAAPARASASHRRRDPATMYRQVPTDRPASPEARPPNDDHRR